MQYFDPEAMFTQGEKWLNFDIAFSLLTSTKVYFATDKNFVKTGRVMLNLDMFSLSIVIYLFLHLAISENQVDIFHISCIPFPMTFCENPPKPTSSSIEYFTSDHF